MVEAGVQADAPAPKRRHIGRHSLEVSELLKKKDVKARKRDRLAQMETN